MSDKQVMTWLAAIFVLALLGAMWLKGQDSSGGARCGQYEVTGECY